MARTIGSHSQSTGPKVRAAATSLFAQKGYAAVSMRQIAADVGVQVGALYTYTSDKQTLLFDLMRDHMRELLSAYENFEDADPVLRLQHFVGFHIQFHRDRPDAVFIAYMELRNLTPENFVVIEDLRKTYEMLLQEIIDDGVTKNIFHVADSKIATLALLAMLTGVNTWFREGGRLSLDDVEQQYQNMALRALGVPLEF
ncbi:MAG: TetR/AcrR family transcriptional regulator [Roseobacter sp.]